MSIIDSQLESQAGWELHTGSDIGGVTPTSYGTYQAGGIRVFYISNPPGANWLAALHRPVVQPNTGKLSLSFDLMVDDNVSLLAQALEFDTRVSVVGDNYNHSSQLNYAEGGMWQISDGTQLPGTAKWVDTGFRYGKLLPDVWNQLKFEYSFDITKKVYSTVAISVNGVRFLIPPNLQNLKPTRPTPLWADSCNLQVQLDQNSGSGEFSTWMRNIQYSWT
jgi:hypothetical protein